VPETIDARQFRSDRAWGAREIAEIDGATIRLHWTDAPYIWHVNDGTEVFVVVDGTVDMHFRDPAGEHVAVLSAGDIFVANAGDAHVAKPQGEARILVVERKGSI
jgi:mannose-6-phosphate isomerase-like protein (cupin superfamily)